MPSSGGQTCALRSEEHTSELQSHDNLVCRLLLAKNNRRLSVRRLLPDLGAHHLSRAHRATPSREATRITSMALGYGGDQRPIYSVFCFNDTATTEIYPLSLHDALPIWPMLVCSPWPGRTTMSSASGSTLSRRLRSIVGWSPPGRSVRPIEPAKSRSPDSITSDTPCSPYGVRNVTDPSVWPGV